jgi:ABC-type multidrug transport system fused ATPase/permease subunit
MSKEKSLAKIIFQISEVRFYDLLKVIFCILAIGLFELLSLALIGGYLGFIVNKSEVLPYFDNLGVFGSFFTAQDSYSQYLILGTLLFATFLIKFVVILIGNYQIINFGLKQQVRMQKIMINNYLSQSYESFIVSNSSFSIVAATSFTRKFKEVLIAIFRFFSDSLVLLSAVLILAVVNIEMFLLLIGLFSIASCVYFYILIPKLREYGSIFNMSNSRMVESLSESSSGFKEIKVYRKESFFENKFNHSAAQMAATEIRQNIISIIPRNFFELILVFFIVAFVILGNPSSENFGDLIFSLGIFAAAAIRIMPTLTQLYMHVNTINFSRDAIFKLYDLVKDNKIFNKTSSKNFQDLSSQNNSEFLKLSLKNVSFSYGNDLILKDCNLEIFKGDYLGIIGESGSGKTTLVDLILGFLKPSSGDIIFNGTDLTKALEEWKSKISYIPQEIFILDSSLQENILLGDPPSAANIEKMHASIKGADLEKVIESSLDGANMQLGERGINLSGGQRQRVALARAIYHDKEIIILDEATSALDKETEKRILGQISTISKNKTIISISHKESALDGCNKIISIRNKCIELN